MAKKYMGWALFMLALGAILVVSSSMAMKNLKEHLSESGMTGDKHTKTITDSLNVIFVVGVVIVALKLWKLFMKKGKKE